MVEIKKCCICNCLLSVEEEKNVIRYANTEFYFCRYHMLLMEYLRDGKIKQ